MGDCMQVDGTSDDTKPSSPTRPPPLLLYIAREGYGLQPSSGTIIDSRTHVPRGVQS